MAQNTPSCFFHKVKLSRAVDLSQYSLEIEVTLT